MNPCTKCGSSEGPMILGPMDAPFCGCVDCGARTYKSTSVAKAIAKWNRRHPSKLPKVPQTDPRGHRQKQLNDTNPFKPHLLPAVKTELEVEKHRR